MRLPPPTTKDATLETVMATLPNFHQASLQMSITWQLGRCQPTMVRAGCLGPRGRGWLRGEVALQTEGQPSSPLPFSSLAQVALGQHEEEYFSGPGPKAVLTKFREELAALDKDIEVRNAKLALPYEYLRPSRVENSVAI